jgi:hypothetical protein
VLGIDQGATLQIENGLLITGVDFAAAGDARLVLYDSDNISTLAGFGSRDVIDLATLQASALRFGNGTLFLYQDQVQVDTLAFAGTYTEADIRLLSDGHGGTDIDFAAAPADLASDAVPHRDIAAAGAAELRFASHANAATSFATIWQWSHW